MTGHDPRAPFKRQAAQPKHRQVRTGSGHVNLQPKGFGRNVLIATDDSTTQAPGEAARPAISLFGGSFLSVAALRRDLATLLATRVVIVSGKHGLVRDTDVVDPYGPGDVSEQTLRSAVAALRDELAAGDALPILLLKSETLNRLLALPPVHHPGPLFFVGADSIATNVRSFFGVDAAQFHAYRRVGVARIDARAKDDLVSRLREVSHHDDQ